MVTRERRRSSAFLVPVVSIIAAAGCVHYQPAPIVPEENLRTLEGRRVTSDEFRTFVEANLGAQGTWPPSSWDLSLLTLAAFFYHPDLDVARAQWGAARAGIVTAGQRPNPILTLTPLVAPWAEEVWIVEATLDQTIETHRKRGLRVAQAEETSEAARARIASTAWQVRARVRTALVDFWAATARLDVANRQRDLQQTMVQLLEARLRAGLASTLDVNRERLALDRLTVDIRDADRARIDARARVAAALAAPAEIMADASINVDVIDRPETNTLTAATLRRNAVLGRADLRAALAEYAASEAALQLEIAKQYPSLDLGPAYRYEESANRIGLDVSLPLPIRNRNQGPIAEAEARRAEAAARVLAIQAEALSAADRAVAAYTAASNALGAAEAHLDQQRTIAQQVRASFDAGQADRVELTAADLQVATAEQLRVDALVHQRQALGEAEDAIERPLFDASFAPKPLEIAPERGTTR